MSDAVFTRTIENFICEHCGTPVEGNGYTNHCPQCLWSKHVDVHPGDRAEECGGMMEPVAIEGGGPYTILHTCTRCRKQRRIGSVAADNQDALVNIAAKYAANR